MIFLQELLSKFIIQLGQLWLWSLLYLIMPNIKSVTLYGDYIRTGWRLGGKISYSRESTRRNLQAKPIWEFVSLTWILTNLVNFTLYDNHLSCEISKSVGLHLYTLVHTQVNGNWDLHFLLWENRLMMAKLRNRKFQLKGYDFLLFSLMFLINSQVFIIRSTFLNWC